MPGGPWPFNKSEGLRCMGRAVAHRALLIVDRSDGFVWGRAGLYRANA